MGSLAPISLKFGDELALVCDLPLAIRYLVLSFRQTLLEGSGIHLHSVAALLVNSGLPQPLA